jgi:putative DNA primase/helicase
LATDISLDSMERACSIGAWHLNESLRFFGLLALPRPLMDAARLDEWLLWKCRNTGAATVSRRDAQRQGPVRDGARLDAALAELQSANRAFLLEAGRQRNIAIHPALVRGSA